MMQYGFAAGPLSGRRNTAGAPRGRRRFSISCTNGGTGFKNVQVLKGIPVDEFMDTDFFFAQGRQMPC